MAEIDVRPIGPENLRDLNVALEPFALVGRIVPVFDGTGWSWTEALLEVPGEKCFPPEVGADRAGEYIDSPDRQIFFAYIGGACAGQVVVRRNWNACCYVEDLAVGAAYRRRGVAGALLAAAEVWGKQHHLRGFMLEAQDTNLLACRAYAAMGFALGGVDSLLYRNCAPPANGELALFWYRPFSIDRS